MSNFQTVFNEYTKQNEVQFQATLVSLSDTEMENKNGTPYYLATVEFENAKGINVQRSAIVYKANADNGMTPGKSYLCTAITGDQGTLIRMSHLEQAARATADDFGDAFTSTTVNKTATVAEGQVA